VSVLAPAAALKSEGYRVEVLSVDSNGSPDCARIRSLTAAGTCLVATSWANGESGHVCDVAQLATAVANGSLFHLDAAQAAGRIPVRLGGGIHMASLSAHKFGGPRGVGALVLSCDPTAIAPLLRGGPQEGGLRPGTENLASIVGFGVAASCATREMPAEITRLQGLRDRLWTRLAHDVPDIHRISPRDGLPNTLTVALASIGGDVLTAALDLRGFAVSTGAACAAGAPEPSHVVRGLGIPEAFRRGVVRLSMGRETTSEDVERLADVFADVVQHVRKAA
jgi:cysteine desulfurase